MATIGDYNYLLQALAIANSRRGYCAPNPAVGAVVVHHHQVIGRGVHWAVGYPHAEVEALTNVIRSGIQEVTLYVTLEPCCHQGRTPPCVDFIMTAKIVRRVVFAHYDPNPQVSGKGMAALIAGGIECDYLPLSEVAAFYKSYVYWTRYRRPWITLKLALSADHKIAGSQGQPLPITGEACNRLTHQHRHRADGILTTAQTVVNDDPQMNVRFSHTSVAKPLFILDRRLRIERRAQVFKTTKHIVRYYCDDYSELVAKSPTTEVEYVTVPVSERSLDLVAVLQEIGQRGVHDLWVEVGARAFRSFYQGGLVNHVIFYRSSQRLGDHGLPAFSDDFNPVKDLSINWEPLGEDECACLTIE